MISMMWSVRATKCLEILTSNGTAKCLGCVPNLVRNVIATHTVWVALRQEYMFQPTVHFTKFFFIPHDYVRLICFNDNT